MIRSLLIFLSVSTGVVVGYRTGLYSVGLMMIATSILLRYHIVKRILIDLTVYKKMTRLHSVWPCLLLFGVGSLSGAWNSPEPSKLPVREETGIIAEVTDRKTTTNGEIYDIDIDRITTSTGETIDCRNVKGVLLTSAETVLEPGDIVSYRSTIELPDAQGAFQLKYRTYDKVRIYENRTNSRGKEVYHYREGELRVIGQSKGLLAKAWKWRENIIMRLENSGLSDESSRLMTALLTGRRTVLKEDGLSGFRDAGVAHVLAVSGMHVGILVGLLLWLTIPLNLVGGRIWRFILTLVAVWIYAVLTGMQVSILRSTIMLSLLVLSWATGRRRDTFRSLCMAGVIILLLWPQSLWDVGFQLSFSCVGALILLGEQLNPLNRRRHHLLHKLVGVFLVSMVATGVTWVISAYYFGSIPVNFLAANLVLLPALPILMGAGIIYLLFLSFGFEIECMSDCINMAIDMLFRFIDIFRGTSLTVSPSALTVWIWMAGVVWLVWGVHRFRPEARMRSGALPLLNPVTEEGIPRIWWTGIYIAVSLFFIAIAVEIFRFQAF